MDGVNHQQENLSADIPISDLQAGNNAIKKFDNSIFKPILNKDQLSLYKVFYNYFLFNPPLVNGSISTIYAGSSSKDKSAIQDVIKTISKQIIIEKKQYLEKMIENELVLRNDENFVVHKELKQTHNYLYLIYPIMDGGSLEQILERNGGTISEIEAVPIIYKICLLIESLHKKNIAHRDINPSHILVSLKEKDKPEFRLGGFLCAHNIGKYGKCKEPAGSEDYMAPEVKNSLLSKQEYDFSCDIYSLGVMIYRMLIGEVINYDVFEEKIKASNLDNLILDLLIQCIEPDASKRMNIKNILEHKLFKANSSLNKIALKANEVNPSISENHCKIPTRDSREPYIIDKTKKLGVGGFSKVYLCHMNNNPQIQYAIKIVKTHKITSKKILGQLQSEIDLMMQLKGLSYVINLTDFFYFKSKLHLVLEYCNGDNLQRYVEKLKIIKKFLDFEELKIISWNIAAALDQMHKKNMIHRDIKPLNILLNKNSKGVLIDAKLCDFGLSKKSDVECASILGTPAYFAPELYTMWSGKKGTYSNKVDIWSYGSLLYFMSYNIEIHAYPPNTREKIYNQGIIEFPKSRPISNEFLELMNACLTHNPLQRPSFEEIMSFPFFSLINLETPKNFPFFLNEPYISKTPEAELFTEKSGNFLIKKITQETLHNKEAEKHIKREIDILTKMRGCPNLIVLEKSIKYKSEIYLVYQLCNGGNLVNFLNKNNFNSFSIEMIKFVGEKIAESLDFLHCRNVIHRNIAPANIFLNILNIEQKPNEIISCLLGDFGLSRILTRNESEMSIVAHEHILYSSPEILNGSIYREDTDIYSYGMLLYFMFYGLTHEQFCLKEKLSGKSKNTIVFPSSPKIPDELCDLIISCIREPNKRPTAQEILKHKFLENTPTTVKIK